MSSFWMETVGRESLIAADDTWGLLAGMAVSQGWVELVGPSMLIGTFGYVIGNYLGTVVAVSLGL